MYHHAANPGLCGPAHATVEFAAPIKIRSLHCMLAQDAASRRDKATSARRFMPFSHGIRSCVGQNLVRLCRTLHQISPEQRLVSSCMTSGVVQSHLGSRLSVDLHCLCLLGFFCSCSISATQLRHLLRPLLPPDLHGLSFYLVIQ